MKKIKKFLHKLLRISQIRDIVESDSYYPELQRKSKMQRYIDNIRWLFKYSYPNKFYNLYGQDIKDKNDYDTFCEYNYFMETRNEFNMNLDTPKDKYNYIAILRDKNVFEKYLSSFNIKTVETIAYIKNGVLYDEKLENEIDEKKFLSNNDVFIKEINGECAEAVYHCKNYDDFANIKNKLKNALFLVQKKIVQHDQMNDINPCAVNTIRMITINDHGNIKLLSSVLRVGTKKSDVDNWATGGLAIPVKLNGQLEKYGFYKPGFGIKTNVHPDTEIVFETFTIPFYKEAIELVFNAHSKLYGIPFIGWDVAITSEGPLLIEGNDNFEISLNQTTHGLKKEWEEIIKSLRK